MTKVRGRFRCIGKKKPSGLFIPPDVILEGEGIKLHVRKQMLVNRTWDGTDVLSVG